MHGVTASAAKASVQMQLERDRRSASQTAAKLALFVRITLAIASACLVVSAVPYAFAVVIADDFSDGTDGSVGTPTNPTPSPPNVTGPIWSRYDAEVFSAGQGWDASTGQYRLTAPDNGAFASAGGQYGFVGSYVNQNFNDFSASVDVVKPTGSPTYLPTGYLFGILAHTNGNNLNAFDPSGGLTGYLFGYNQSGVPGTPRIEITKLTAGAGTSAFVFTPVVLDLANKNYRLTLTQVGNVFTGKVFEIGNPTPLAIASGPDNNVRSVPAFTSGYNGLFGLSLTAAGDVDVTFDNFTSEDLVAGTPGDFNNNGVVDAADYAVWRKNDGTSNALPNDNGLGTPIGSSHYNLWRSHFGQPPGSGTELVNGGPVPEPAGIGLALLGLAFSGCCRRR